MPDITVFADDSDFERQWQDFLSAKSFEGERTLRRKDGSLRVVDYRAVAHIQPGTHVSVIRDVTERRRMEEHIRQSENRLQLAMQAGRLGSWEWDAGSNRLEASVECKAIFGLAPAADFSFEIALNMIHPEDRDRVQHLLQDTIENDSVYEAEFRIAWPDGSLHWVRSRGRSIYDPDAGAVRVVGVSLDITEVKQRDEERDSLLAREREARREAESANRAKDQFLAMVSHELRTPLSTILGWTQIIKAKKVDAETIVRAITVIERNAQLQTRMIEDLLDFSRIVAGSLRLRVENVSLSELIENVVDSVGPAAETKGVTIEADVQPPGLRVEGDSMRLQQVMHNLVFNALKFTPHGGRISITAGTDGNTATIQVMDTGSGISADFLPHIFESFRQAETRPSRRQGGLGLGLAIVKHLVELHGGHVEASSDGLNRGAMFTVKIPVSNRVRQAFQQGMSDAMEGELATDALKGLRILVVDDEAVALRMLKAFLERQGAEVHPSTNASEAIKELEEWMPDVLLSDIRMPDEDGLELISRVRVMDSEPVRNVLAIALTGHTREADRLKALSAGYQMFMPKSVKPEELVETIATLVKNR